MILYSVVMMIIVDNTISVGDDKIVFSSNDDNISEDIVDITIRL